MTQTPSAPPMDARLAYQAAHAAAQAERWDEARDRLLGLEASGGADDEALALLGLAWLRTGNAASATAAIDRVLQRDPRHLRAVLAKAELLSADGALREANVFYSAAVDIGDRAGYLPADLARGVAHARDLQARLQADRTAHLEQALEAAGFQRGRSHPRFAHALDIAAGRRQPYFQQPKAFYYPELPNTQFYPREDFPWLDRVEAATEAIREELQGLLADEGVFSPYVKSAPGLPSQKSLPLVDSLDWSACHLWKDGAETAYAARCPRTLEALSDAPLCRVRARSPQVMFSQLKAGAHIVPHVGFVNTRLICHLPLITPPDCRFRVGNEVREWETGRAWVFDDTIEHEALNQSDRSRVVLIFDIWRPELSAEERALVATLLESLDAYAPSRESWA